MAELPKEKTMILNRNFLFTIAICIFVLILASSAAAREIDEYTLLSFNLPLGSSNNGFVPSDEEITIEFSTDNIADVQNPRFKIFIPICSFVKEKLWYEIYEPTKPSEIGIKVFSFDDSTGEVIENLTDTLLFFEAIFISKDETSHYLFVEAVFEHENTKVLFPVSINSSKKSLLIGGNDIGTTF
jgi:hypothetical protein